MFRLVRDTEDFIIISKDPGVSFHGSPATLGLAAAVRSRLGLSELYTVHRLDQMTSGLLLFARSRAVAEDLGHQFRERLVEKYYIALSDRKPKKKQGLIKGDMTRTRGGKWKLLRTHENPALTRFFSFALRNGLRLFLLRPLTGKTHQIRVALKSLGAPILGDSLYHGKTYDEEPDRGYLHAYALRFSYKGKMCEVVDMPQTGRHFLDDAFQQIMVRCGRPWELPWPRSGLRETKKGA